MKKIICPICGKKVSGYIPRGGDGSALRPYRHGDCEGRFELVTDLNTDISSDDLPFGGWAPNEADLDLFEDE